MTGLLRRELQLLWQGRARLLPLFVYPLLVLLISVFALDIRSVAISTRQALLLIALVLAQLTILPLAWRDELQSGVMAQLWLARRNLLLAVWLRYLVWLLLLALPLALILLLAGQMLLQVPAVPLIGIFLPGLPPLLGLALLTGALMVGQSSNALPALLLLPLYVPVVILMGIGISSADPAVALACRYWLGALAALSLGLLPFGIAAGLRQALALS